MSSNPPNAILQPRPTSTRLANRFEFAIAGLWCPRCGDTIRVIDAEPLDGDGMRLVCRCGQLILQYELQP
jgi:hypothetical protein